MPETKSVYIIFQPSFFGETWEVSEKKPKGSYPVGTKIYKAQLIEVYRSLPVPPEEN